MRLKTNKSVGKYVVTLPPPHLRLKNLFALNKLNATRSNGIHTFSKFKSAKLFPARVDVCVAPYAARSLRFVSRDANIRLRAFLWNFPETTDEIAHGTGSESGVRSL